MISLRSIVETLRRNSREGRRRILRNEKGAALITALMFMLVLTMLGMASIMTSNTEMMLATNYKLEALALANANAGVQEAIARLDLDSGSLVLGSYTTMAPEANPASSWSFTSTDSGTDLGEIVFTGNISYRLEDALHNFAGYSSTSPRVVGYSKDCNYDKSPIESRDAAFPVYVVLSTGRVMSGTQELSSATVSVEVSRNTLNLNVPGALYSTSCINTNGNANIIGSGSTPALVTPCGGSTYPPPAVVTPSTDEGGGISTLENVTSMATPSFVGVSFNELKKMAIRQNLYFGPSDTPDPGSGWGSESNPAIVYVEGDYHITGNSSNYGILVVEGDLTTGGVMQWNGLIYVRGDLDAALGTFEVNGGVMAGGANLTNVGGTADINFNHDILENIARRACSSKLINWRRMYN